MPKQHCVGLGKVRPTAAAISAAIALAGYTGSITTPSVLAAARWRVWTRVWQSHNRAYMLIIDIRIRAQHRRLPYCVPAERKAEIAHPA